MTIAELIDGLTKCPNKDRDVMIHVHGTLSGIVDLIGIDELDGEGEPSEFSIYLDGKPTEARFSADLDAKAAEAK